jgi:hypothetical protein
VSCSREESGFVREVDRDSDFDEAEKQDVARYEIPAFPIFSAPEFDPRL